MMNSKATEETMVSEKIIGNGYGKFYLEPLTKKRRGFILSRLDSLYGSLRMAASASSIHGISTLKLGHQCAIVLTG